MVHKFFDKKSSGGSIKNKISSNQELAEGLRQFFRKLEKWEVYLCLKNNIWGDDLADTQLMSKYNKEFFFYYVSSIFIVNMIGLFLWNMKKVLQLLMLFKKFWISLGTNQTKYGYINVAKFTID